MINLCTNASLFSLFYDTTNTNCKREQLNGDQPSSHHHSPFYFFPESVTIWKVEGNATLIAKNLSVYLRAAVPLHVMSTVHSLQHVI